MRFGALLIAVFLCSCAFFVRQPERSDYRATVLYSDQRLKGASFTGQSLLVLPVLTKNGPDTVGYISPRRQSQLLRKARGDLNVIYREDVEKKYCSIRGRDKASLDRFYASLYKGEMVAVQTSDSVWQAVNAAYLFAVRIRYAAIIRGFDGNAHRRLALEAEVWNVAAAEAVWRVEVTGFDERPSSSDGRFVEEAVREALKNIPGFLPAKGEEDW